MAMLGLLKSVAKKYTSTSLILRILIGLIIGMILALTMPKIGTISLLGDLFVGSLKAIAPILVFVLVAGALAQKSSRLDRRFAMVIWLYMLSTFLAAVVAAVGSYLFPQTLVLSKAAKASAVPQGIGEVIRNVLMNVIANPFDALVNANYIGILFWAVLFGLAMKRYASDSSRTFMLNVSDAISQLVRWIINLAPFGIMGLVYKTVSSNGLTVFTTYGKILLLLIGCMLVVS